MSTAEEKRLKSLEEKKKAYQLQKSVIKNALNNVDFQPQQKISFENELEENSKKIPSVKRKKQKIQLFDETADVETSNDFALKEQFEGKHGEKLLELQTRFRNDKRFTLDSRFVNDEENNGTESKTEFNLDQEKRNESEILAQVLGKNVPTSGEQTKSSMGGMRRFDPSKPSHAIFEKHDQQTDETSSKAKKKKRVCVVNETKVAVNETSVSKDTFYKVSSTLRESLQEKKSFSLLNMFGTENSAPDACPEEDTIDIISKKKQIGPTRNPFRYDSSDSENEEVTNNNPKQRPAPPPPTNNVSGIWKENFFFTANDDRLKEGVDFIMNIQNQQEGIPFSDTRRELKEIIRAKVRNNKRNIRPFKKKLGGRKVNFYRKK